VRLKQQLYRHDWVVDAKRLFAGAVQVFRYLGRYTHRVGLSNHRLLAADGTGVRFATKHGRAVCLPPDEFIRRFLLHVLPARFVRRRLPLIGPRRVRRVECLFDTGASPSFIRPELVRRLRLSTASLPRSLRIRLGKRSTPVSQLAAVMIRLDGATLADAAYVMPGLTEEYVVGAEFLERHNIRFDPKRRRLVLPARSRLALILV